MFSEVVYTPEGETMKLVEIMRRYLIQKSIADAID